MKKNDAFYFVIAILSVISLYYIIEQLFPRKKKDSVSIRDKFPDTGYIDDRMALYGDGQNLLNDFGIATSKFKKEHSLESI